MGEPGEGASLGSARAPRLDPPADLVEADESDPEAEVTASSSSSSSESEEEKVERGDARKRIRRSTQADMMKYQWCSWPSVVDLKADKAKRIIRKGKPDLYCEVIPQNQIMTMAYCTNRVRLIVDRSNRIVRTPRVG